MTTEQRERLFENLTQQEKVFDMWLKYWMDFSAWGTWEFWAIVFTMVIPLIVIFFRIDKKNAFLIGFYGFNIHTWFTYSDAIVTRSGYVVFPFQAFPMMPVNFALDASLIPVSFMLLYQWCINRNKSVLLYGVILSAFFSFIFKPILVSLDLMLLPKNLGYFALFLNYLLILVLSILITKLFSYFVKVGQN